MDFDLPTDRGRTSVVVPPGVALAVVTIVAAGVTGLAVAGLTWTLDRPARQSTGVPPDVQAFEPAPSPATSGPIDTPGYNEALGLPAPAPVSPGATAVEGVGAAAPTMTPGQEETVRRAAAARRPVVGPTASVRSAPDRAPTAAAPGVSATTVPGVTSTAPDPGTSGITGAGTTGVTAPGTTGVTAPGTTGVTAPGTAGVTDPAAGVATATDPAGEPDPAFEPTATETTAPQRRREPPRRQWRDEPPQQAPAPQWGGPFGDFPRMFPWR